MSKSLGWIRRAWVRHVTGSAFYDTIGIVIANSDGRRVTVEMNWLDALSMARWIRHAVNEKKDAMTREMEKV